MVATFSSAQTFEDLIAGYLKYLNGEITRVPTYAGELEPDTIPQLGVLKRINKLGFLTIDSQDGLHEKEGEEETYQRAYVHGFMRKDVYNRFSSKMIATDLICMGYPITRDPCNTGMSIVVTRERGEATGRKWRDYTQMPLSVLDQSDWELLVSYSPKVLIEKDDIYQVTIIDPVWKRSNYLMEVVHKML